MPLTDSWILFWFIKIMHNFKLSAPADQLNYISYVHNKFITT
jgi:hypothetical protein